MVSSALVTVMIVAWMEGFEKPLNIAPGVGRFSLNNATKGMNKQRIGVDIMVL